MQLPDGSERGLLYGAAVLLVLGLFLFTLLPVLTPVVLFLALLLLLAPFAGTRGHLMLVTAVALLSLLWLLKTTGFLLAPFILAFVIAYILDPVVDALERWRVPRALAILLLSLPAVGLVLLALLVGIPALLDQVEALIQRAPALLQSTVAAAERARRGVLGLDLPAAWEEAVVERLRALDAEQIVLYLQTRQEELVQRSWRAVLGVGRGIGTLLAALGYVVLTPVLVYYLLRDWDRLTHWVEGLIPRERRDRWTGFAIEYDRLLASYLRGQVAAAVAVGTLTGFGLWLLDFPYAGLVGSVAGIFNLVPYLGLVVSLVPAVLIALLSGSAGISLLKVGAVFIVVQVLDGSVIGPRIVGGSVGLHPVWVILALTVSGFFFGFVGLLIAVPGAVLLKLLLRDAIARYRESRFFTGAAGGV